MDRQRTVLIIEDQEMNRALLEGILGDECVILQAENGQEGLDILANREDVAAIVLDLIMPVMDGFVFMERLSQIPSRRNIPVIVATEHGAVDNEKKALKLGAYDFVSKPYDPTVVRLRVHNAIEHSRLVALETLQYLEEYDGLTGIYNKNSFIMATRQMLNEENPDDKYAIVRFDVTRFAMINAYYGVKEGDRLLKHIAQKIREEAQLHHRMTFGRMGADDFCVCTRYSDIDELYAGIERARTSIVNYDLSFNIILIFGIYQIVDRNQEIEAMIANANMAAKRIKGNYLNTIAVYDEKLSKQREEEQVIINEMKYALEDEQFVVYLQPKYNSSAGLPCGAEALIRWKHPEKGMIPPGVFIPVFESNGFVEPIDHYMWEHVCILLHKWIEQGVEPNPISVNVSRVNLFNPRIVEEICELTEKYNVPKKYLQLEITESAYTDNGDMILGIINKFHDAGFTILMDDFGSGYSSLNVLKDMHVDVLKIDMKFFGRTENASRAETIISSVVRMAKWLNIGTVAEGVETREQVDFLKSVGCLTIQGYYYAKPMPVDEYEELIMSGEKFTNEEESASDTFEWVNSPEIDELFASVMDPMCMSEVSDGEIEILRVNQAYYELLGYEDQIMFIRHPMDKALDEYKTGLKDAYQKTVETRENQEYFYKRYDANGDIVNLRIELKFMNEFNNRYLVCCYFYKVEKDNDADNSDEKNIKAIIDACREKAEADAGKERSYIPACGHLPELVNTVLSSKYQDKHAMILVSVDNVEEVEKLMGNKNCSYLWNSMECVLNQHFRNIDMIAQTDDHEYCIFMSSVPSEEVVSIKCHELNRKFKLFSHISKFPVKLSIGVAVSSKEDRDFDNLYYLAASALRKGREYGGNRVYMSNALTV